MQLVTMFREIFGAPAEEVYSAAGRVNLIGEHVDYCGGKVLPAALSLKCRVAVRKNGTNLLRVAATDISARAEIDLNALENYKALKWGNYQAGVADEMKKAGYNLVGCDILYDCTVPFGSGLSSSAAIEVVTAYALAKTGGNKIDKKELAVLAQKAENNYCGVNCGIMDQFASANGKEKHALLLDCATLDYELLPLDLKECVLVLTNCNKPHNLVESKYNERRSEVDKALSLLQKRISGISCLADVKPYQVEENRSVLTPLLYRRARHVVGECDRVLRSAEALKTGDLELFGRLLNESHRSLKEDYEVTGKELDALAEAAQNSPECLGSRMTGAGFGGCTVSLVRKTGLERFQENVGKEYTEKIGYAPTFYVAEVADGIIDEGRAEA